METGTIRWFNNDKNYGFVIPDKSALIPLYLGGNSIFAVTSLSSSQPLVLEADDKVKFVLLSCSKGVTATIKEVVKKAPVEPIEEYFTFTPEEKTFLLSLDKRVLVSLAKGETPGYIAMDHSLIKENGIYDGSYGRWSWDRRIKRCTKEELIEIYLICVNS